MHAFRLVRRRAAARRRSIGAPCCGKSPRRAPSMISKNPRCCRNAKCCINFRARGHELTQVLLAHHLIGVRDGVGAYYRSRPLVLGLGLPARGRAGLDHDARRRHERRARHRCGVQPAAQIRRLRAAGVRRRRHAIHPGRGLGAGPALSRARAGRRKNARTALPWPTAAMHRRPRTAFGRRSTS